MFNLQLFYYLMLDIELGSRNKEVLEPVFHREIPPLESLCIKHVAKRLQGCHHQIQSLGGLPHSVCEKLIKQLMKDKALNPKSMQPFLSW